METIKRAAIRHNGTVYSVPAPGRHHNVIREMIGLGFGSADVHDQGFLTSTQRFVDRKEGFQIAKAAGQLIETEVNKRPGTKELFSEDMW